MATVKSLEERIDEMAEDLTGVKGQLRALSDDVAGVKGQLRALESSQSTVQAQLANLVSGQGATQAQLAVQTARLDATNGHLDRTISRFDTTVGKIEALATEFSGFRARTENSFGVAKWAVTFAAGVFITVLGSAIWVVRELDRVNGRIDQQQVLMTQQLKTLDEIRSKLK